MSDSQGAVFGCRTMRFIFLIILRDFGGNANLDANVLTGAIKTIKRSNNLTRPNLRVHA